MNKVLGLIVIALVGLTLVSCKDSMKEASIYNDKSELLTTVDDKKEVAELVKAWKSKERALEKLMPLFEYKIAMEVDGEMQTWLFNKAGYLMQENTSTLYKTKAKDVFAKHVK